MLHLDTRNDNDFENDNIRRRIDDNDKKYFLKSQYFLSKVSWEIIREKIKIQNVKQTKLVDQSYNIFLGHSIDKMISENVIQVTENA